MKFQFITIGRCPLLLILSLQQQSDSIVQMVKLCLFPSNIILYSKTCKWNDKIINLKITQQPKKQRIILKEDTITIGNVSEKRKEETMEEHHASAVMCIVISSLAIF